MMGCGELFLQRAKSEFVGFRELSGMDIERVNIVINYDFPAEADQYLHRVGCAGRFGTKSLAVSFIASAEDKEILKQVQDRFQVSVDIARRS